MLVGDIFFITRKPNNNRYLWIPSSKNVTVQFLFEWHTYTYIYEWYTNKHISIKMQTNKNFPCCYRSDSGVIRCVWCVIKFDRISSIYKKSEPEIINFIPSSNVPSKSTLYLCYDTICKTLTILRIWNLPFWWLNIVLVLFKNISLDYVETSPLPMKGCKIYTFARR